MTTLLTVTADDFGLSTSVNAAVEAAFRDGILTSTSLMVGAPCASDAVARARRLDGLKTGLHLVLISGSPSAEPERIPALLDDRGRFPDAMGRTGVSYFFRRSVRRQLKIEIRAQFEAYAATGLELDHVDVHRHFHLHPTIADLMLRIGSDYGLRAVRLPREPRLRPARGANRSTLPPTGTPAYVKPWLNLLRRRLERSGIRHNDHMLGLSSTGRMTESTVLHLFDHLPSGATELYFHPALTSGSEVSADMSGYRHYEEYQTLTSPRVKEKLDGLEAIRLGSYSEA